MTRKIFMAQIYKKSIVAALMVATLAFTAIAFTGCSATTSSTGTLKVGVLSDVSGMSEYNESNDKFYGMEVDLAEEMANRMGYAGFEAVGVSTDNGAEKLESGEVDALAACFSITDQRKETFSFSESYYEDKLVLMVENSSLITTTQGLSGLTIGTLTGANTSKALLEQLEAQGFTTGEVVSSNEKGTDVRYDTWHLQEFDTLDELSDALEAGTIDAMATDGAIANNYRFEDRSFIKDFAGEKQSYAVATMKDSELASKVNDAIQSMIDDGTVDALKEKWS